MRWKPWSTGVVILLAIATLASWQYREYVQDRDSARETLHRQAHSVMSILVGGFHAHRRRGRFFVDQVEGSLQQLVGAEDILAVGIASEAGQLILSQGDTTLLKRSSLASEGDFWDAAGFRLVESFDLPPASSRMGNPAGRGSGEGRGGGRGLRSQTLPMAEFESVFSVGGKFAAILVLDRAQLDSRCRRAALLRSLVVATGGLLLMGATLASWLTVKAAGRARILEYEARHLRDLSQAAAGLAHETRNPLGLIRGWAQRLGQSGSLLATQQEHADAIVEECDRVTARINQFLAFARPVEPKLESVCIGELIDQLAILLEPDLSEKQVTLDSGRLGNSTILADREMLRQVLFNLIQNAIQASPMNGTVEIRMRSGQDGSRRVEVANQGSVIAEEVVESLFVPYFTTRSDGTGLGLAIVRHIASVHGWETGYTPNPVGGAIFWLDGIHD